ncbi:MAG: S8 family serine peptidase [Vampirovibrionales bacterium]|nr:S8 family serine peptidase [Vampirovibrionales bacterium]
MSISPPQPIAYPKASQAPVPQGQTAGENNAVGLTEATTTQQSQQGEPEAKKSLNRTVANKLPQGWPDIQRLALGIVLPNGNLSLSLRVQVDGQGNIYQPTIDGFEPIGKMDTNGNYRFKNGLQGNCFRDGQFELKVEHAENPFQKALLESKQKRASAGSIVPLVRQNLTANGIDGRGITIADIEPFEVDKNEPGKKQLFVSPHSQAVAAVIHDPYWGVAPGAIVKNFGWYSPEFELKKDDLSEFNQLPPVQQVYGEMIAQLDRVLQEHQKDPSLRVVNISWGLTLLEFYIETLNVLQEEDPKTGHFKFPLIRQAVLGDTQHKTREEQFMAIERYINALLIQNPLFTQLHRQYVEKTREVKDQGLIIFLSAANAHDQLPFTVPLPPGHEMTLWANSPYVISVAASDTNLTPADTRDDIIAPFSSRGDAQHWNPTIAAPGAEIGMTQQFGTIGLGLVTKGTSYSSPISAGIAAMMLQENPNLTFEDIRDRLIQTATKTAHPFAAQGYGILNPIEAVKSAKQIPSAAAL